MCAQIIRDGTLVCVREHDDAGHVYHSTSGVPDRHELGDDE